MCGPHNRKAVTLRMRAHEARGNRARCAPPGVTTMVLCRGGRFEPPCCGDAHIALQSHNGLGRALTMGAFRQPEPIRPQAIVLRQTRQEKQRHNTPVRESLQKHPDQRANLHHTRVVIGGSTPCWCTTHKGRLEDCLVAHALYLTGLQGQGPLPTAFIAPASWQRRTWTWTSSDLYQSSPQLLRLSLCRIIPTPNQL